jgi:predicted RNase H-like HicB family nuclease
MSFEVTAVYRRGERYWVGFIEEIPGINTQGSCLEQVRQNLVGAAELIMDAQSALRRENR